MRLVEQIKQAREIQTLMAFLIIRLLISSLRTASFADSAIIVFQILTLSSESVSIKNFF